ncbi:replication-associated recombination protein A [Inhella gelatinilytica]|uniref:Replication-associated recombination protein A n=1 Tax=Inhella gelatinilytica TaxID=2795030 RepID=A0A931J1H3_9BURK|nr:replication-associated recombination protein A [Inhella gelatinilytica]MBH9553778.1 replication-associated recombination protein A [Inhella gelatinilytica]
MSTDDLFATAPAAPLAERLRPTRLDEVVGQTHLLGPGKVLRVAAESRQLHSMILWGPPGVGKTTLARLLAEASGLPFIAISAVLGGVKDIRDAVEQARLRGQAVVFVDEVHRFNKAQQDAFLPHVESGLFVFIGATTENPSFEVNAALLSRARVHVLQSLSEAEQQALVSRAAQALGVTIPADAAQALMAWADGDARRLLNAAEAVARVPGALTPQGVAEVLGARQRRFDKGGDTFYDQLSAFHKSVRGSDPDAAIYWLVRMLDGGADGKVLTRRMLAIAAEDVGLADPRGLELTVAATQAFERLGSPEGELALAEAAIYLAVAPKSNAGYLALKAARAVVASDGARPVPLHLRNAPTALMKQMGHGVAYRYAHDEPEAFAAGQTYLPEGLEAQRFYEPNDRGLEAKIADKLARLRAANGPVG